MKLFEPHSLAQPTPVSLLFEVTDRTPVFKFKQLGEFRYVDVSNDEVGLSNSSDIIPGQYEGGFRMWECALDLAQYLKDKEVTGRVLELGCGHGLPGIVCLAKGAEVVFQDYNEQVLQVATMNNVEINLPGARAKYYAGA